MKHDPLCREKRQGYEENLRCPDCELIKTVRKEKMTEYVQLRESETKETDKEFLLADTRRVQMVTDVANNFLTSWFPDLPDKGPTGEDLENWKDIAIQDAVVAVRTLLEGAWIDDPTMD